MTTLQNFIVVPHKETGLFYKASLYHLVPAEKDNWDTYILPVLVWPKAEYDNDTDQWNKQLRKNWKEMWMSYQWSDRRRPMFFWNLPKVWFGWPEMYTIQKFLAQRFHVPVKELQQHVTITFINWFL